MRNRLVRLCVVLVLGASAAAAVVMLRGELQMARVVASPDLDQGVDRLLALTTAMHRAEARYVAPDHDPTSALEKFPTLLHELTGLTAATTTMVRSSSGSTALRVFADATSRLAEADAVAREHLLVGDVRSAAHVIFGQASEAADAMTDAVLGVREAERRARLAGAEAHAKQAEVVAVAIGALWVVGLIVLAIIPARRRQLDASHTSDTDVTAAPAIDLVNAADLCAAISRVETTPALNGLLARAVSLLDAEGVLVWMGTLGGELVAAATAGYAPEVATRFSPIRRQDDNVTATAWRDGVTAVAAGTGQAGAVIAIPLFNGETCAGVLSVELRPGRPADAPTQAIVRMIGAQLANVVAGPSVSAGPASAAAATGS